MRYDGITPLNMLPHLGYLLSDYINLARHLSAFDATLPHTKRCPAGMYANAVMYVMTTILEANYSHRGRVAG